MAMAERDHRKKLPVYKVALCGKRDVGKTSIFRRIRGDGFLVDTAKFTHMAEDTIEIQVKDQTIKILLVDTGGMERYGPLTRQHYHGSSAVLLVYDCDDNLSLKELKEFYKCAKDNAVGAAMILVRNKIDKEFQSVDIREAEHLIYTNSRGGTSLCSFIFKENTSAKQNQGIKELFEKVAEYLIKHAAPSNERSNEFDERIRLQEKPSQPTTTPPQPPQPSSGCGC